MDPESVEPLTDFFVRNVSPDYISHGELLAGRAVDDKLWAPNLREIMSRELDGCVNSFQCGGNLRAATAAENGTIVGLAIVETMRDAQHPHAWLTDLIVE